MQEQHLLCSEVQAMKTSLFGNTSISPLLILPSVPTLKMEHTTHCQTNQERVTECLLLSPPPKELLDSFQLAQL